MISKIVHLQWQGAGGRAECANYRLVVDLATFALAPLHCHLYALVVTSTIKILKVQSEFLSKSKQIDYILKVESQNDPKKE